MRHVFIFLITLYQKYLSPHKGFNCAYACYHNSHSCSGAVKKIIAEYGLITGWPLIGKQFQDCRLAYEALQQDDDNSNRRNNRRRNRPNRRNNCSSAKKKCDVVDCIPDSIPDIPCDVIPCDFLRVVAAKKSIHKNTSPD
jgi:putative component of membrane protein insertase Oxa1/YidC/SpoIIIJ protein YidD